MRKLIKHRDFLKSLCKKGTKSCIRKATKNQLSILVEICHNISQIPLTKKAHSQLLPVRNIIKAIAGTRSVSIIRDLLLRISNVLCVLIGAVLELFHI